MLHIIKSLFGITFLGILLLDYHSHHVLVTGSTIQNMWSPKGELIVTGANNKLYPKKYYNNDEYRGGARPMYPYYG